MNKRDIEFLYEVGSLRNIQRGWRQHLGVDCANVLEHTLRVIWLALILARKEGANEDRVLKMALIHDIAETRTSDLSYVQKVYVQADEDKAVKDTFDGTSLTDFYSDALQEYEKRESLESKIVKDADNLDVDLELKELKQKGSLLPEQWQHFRTMIRNEKLYTDAAKELWDILQTVNPEDWHLTANKWLKLPNSGK